MCNVFQGGIFLNVCIIKAFTSAKIIQYLRHRVQMVCVLCASSLSSSSAAISVQSWTLHGFSLQTLTCGQSVEYTDMDLHKTKKQRKKPHTHQQYQRFTSSLTKSIVFISNNQQPCKYQCVKQIKSLVIVFKVPLLRPIQILLLSHGDEG